MAHKPNKSVTRYLPSEPGKAMSASRSAESAAPIGAYVRLQIEGETRGILTLQIAERVLVGRSDEDSDSKPGLDLAPYGGENRGVSRNHAAFSYSGSRVYVEDLGSTNGTRINGLQLAPNQPYHLHDGDEIEFGSARVLVRFGRA